MAERRRIVYFPVIYAAPHVLHNFEDGVSYFAARDSFQVTPGERKTNGSSATRRYGGSVPTSETHENGSIGFKAFVAGTSADDVNAKVTAAISVLESTRDDIFFEWRPDGATYSTFFDIRGPATWVVGYSRPLYVGADAYLVDFTIPVAPLAEGLPMDFYDDFSTPTLAALEDYTFTSGSGTASVVNGLLTPSSTAAKLIVPPQRGYTYGDGLFAVRFTTGATTTNTVMEIMLKVLGSTDNMLTVKIVPGRLSINKIAVGGAVTELAFTTTGVGLAANTSYVLGGRIEGNVVTAGLIPVAGTDLGDPVAYPVNWGESLAYTLTTAEATSWGREVQAKWAFRWTPHATDERVNWVMAKPYFYGGGFSGAFVNFNLDGPHPMQLKGPIPGSAPAKVDVSWQIASSYPWAIIAWESALRAYNYVWNGDFETNVNGWTNAAVTGVVGASTSITQTGTGVPKYGGGQLECVTPATADVGCSFAMYRRFKRGTPYTALVWAQAPVSTTAMKARLGVNGDLASSANSALTTSAQLYTITWTPTADRNTAYVTFQTNAATATTFRIDGVCVFEGTVAPTDQHISGKGSVPPFGRIAAAHADAPTNWTVSGDGLTDATVSNAETYVASFWYDPSLLSADEFSQTVDVELWGSFTTHASLVSPRVVVYAIPDGAGAGTERYPIEYGTAGKILPKPSSSTARRNTRLGTITLPVDSRNRARWKIVVTVTTLEGSAGSITFNELLVNPARQRALGPTGKANDATYPDFIKGASIRTIRSDLSGTSQGYSTREYPDSGLGGQRIEFAPGEAIAYIKLGQVPDDPTSDTSADTITVGNNWVHFAVTPRYWIVR